MDMSDLQGDETVSLSDVLVARDTCLPEDELWALCRECCLVLEVVNNSPDMFLTLCVTPDTVAFDQVGNVCFLDLDVEPEPIYLPPEYSNQGNTYKAHLFSLGMTLLYAAEYNVTDTKEAISTELRDILGRMTADDPASRPDLESTIILCEEQLFGQSSQEVCCGIAAVVGFGLPDEDIVNEGSVLESFVTDTGGSPDDFSHAESYVQSDYGDTTCCDDIPDLTEDISQAESLPSSEQETVVVTEETTESHDDSLLSEEHDNDLKQKSSSSTLKDTSDVNIMQNLVEQTTDTMKESNSNKPAIPKKPDIKQKESTGAKSAVVNGVKQLSGELTVSELFSESESDQSRVDSDKQLVNGKTQNSSNSSSTNSNSDHSRKRERSKDKRSSGSGSSKKETTRDSNQNITYMKHEEKTTDDKTNSDKSVNKDMVLEMNENGILIDSLEPSLENGTTKTKKNKRKQGLTISDILEALDRNLTEPELWALCKEGTMALQRKKKHLPAYLSPDTLVVRESGNLSFKAIPEEKPLEVIFMAPELQKKGELSEKTCLFGLSVTLRCAAGKKYSSVSAMNVSSELKDLLQYLADSNPVRRPELVDIAKICNEHNNGTSSDGICSKLFLEAFKVMNEKEEKAKQSATTESIVKPAPLSAFKPAGGSSLIKPVSGPAFQPPGGSSFQPVKPAPIGGSSCAFAPVPKKKSPNTDPAAEPRIPSAFSSPATHFKPIILQQTQTPINENSKQTSSSTEKEKSTSSKDKPKQSPKQTTVASPKKSSPDPNADKEKEVVKKLKELKKNLMKHKQPSMAKEIENEDKVSDISSHSKSSSSNKKSLPTTPKKSGSQSGERSRKRKGSTGALDALLKEIQKQGNAPDTQSLASAIAGFLQNHLNQSDSTPKSETQSKPVSDLDMTVTSAQSSLGQGQMLPDLNIPSQYHSQLVGQTMTLPPGIQYGSNVYSGLPQFQFQPDPVTGYLQLVPVNVVPMRPQSVHSNSGSAHSVRDFTSPTGSGNIKDLNSPDMSPKTLHNQSDNQSAISDQSGSRGKIPHGRTAKDLVQKTANLRAKNLGRPSPSNLQAMTREPGNMQKWKSDHTLDRSEHQFYSDSERFSKHGSYSSLSYSNKLSTAFVYDDSVLNSARSGPGPVPRPHSQYGPITSHHMRSPEDMHRHNLNSTTSSPSPSTHDSGIGGMNHGIYRGPGSDASLMERLLNSNANVRQQKILGKIVHLLREEFAFDGYMENGVEDLAMAEYICSIGVLKWETFKSAISEKYNDLYWHDEVLHNLYAAVNGGRPSSANRSTSGQSRGPTSQRQRQAGHHDDDSSGHSERDSHRKKSHERLKPNFSPVGQGIADKGNNHLDTSDSTDTENYSKRRRIKTKHELDKRKSSSNTNILVENLQPLNGSVNNNSVTNKPLTNLAANSLNVSVSNTSSLPRNTNRQSAQIDIGQHSNFNSLPKQPVSSITPGVAMASKPPKPQTDASVSPHVTKPNQNKSTINGLSPSSQTSTENVSQGLSREMSMSSHSSSQSDLIREGDTLSVEKRGHVVYHWAMIQLCQSNEIEKFMQGIDEQNRKLLVTKLAALSQEIKMEKRSRRKTQKFYKCLVDNNKSVLDVSKNDKTTKEKNQVLQVAKDITEMTRRIGFVDLCKAHLQMLLAELHGIDVSYLYSISVGPKDEPLQLHPKPENPLLQFQTLREPQTGYEIQALHAGTPDGLMAYLFASTALSDGFIHQFLYCYRYFTTATDVLNFLIDKYASATKSGSTETNISRLQERVVDLLHYWLEGYFSIDFKGKQRLIDTLRNFIRNYIQDDTEGGQSLLSLLSTCCSGSNLELSSADPDDAEMHFWQTSEPKVKTSQTEKKKEWESFKSLVRGKSNAKEKSGKVTISAVCVERRRRSTENPDVFPSRGRRTDLFMLADYTAQCLAEQLCLIEQGIFQLTHPVHYLDSKSRGVGVALTMKGMKTPAMSRRSGGEEGHGLFVEPLQDSLPIQKMIDHAQEVSHWVAGEIVACSNSKTQVAVLSKFLFIAHACIELRNFATSMAILDGLENLIIKQLPAWKNLPSKCSALMEELTKVRMFLKNDPLSLMQQGKECHLYPTIPSSVIFLLHVQQLEIGGFKLANQMFKWGKIRSICQVIDQIRVYREHMYGFEADHNLQDTLRQRIHEMTEQDIHDLAVQHDMNYQKMSSGSGISGAFKKMKGKFK